MLSAEEEECWRIRSVRLFIQALIWNLDELNDILNNHDPALIPQSASARWKELRAFVESTAEDQERFSGEESEQIAKIHQYAIKIITFFRPSFEELVQIKVLHPNHKMYLEALYTYLSNDTWKIAFGVKLDCAPDFEFKHMYNVSMLFDN